MKAPALESQQECLHVFGLPVDRVEAYRGFDPENEGAGWAWAFSNEIWESPAGFVFPGQRAEPWTIVASAEDAAEFVGRPIKLHPRETLATFTTLEGATWEWPDNDLTAASACVADLARVLGHCTAAFELCEIDGKVCDDLACILLSLDQRERIVRQLGERGLEALLRRTHGPERFRLRQ